MKIDGTVASKALLEIDKNIDKISSLKAELVKITTRSRIEMRSQLSEEQKAFMERLMRVGDYIEEKINIYPCKNHYYLRARMWRRWLDKNVFQVQDKGLK